MRFRFVFPFVVLGVFVGLVLLTGGFKTVNDRLVGIAIAVLEPASPSAGSPKTFTVDPGQSGAQIAEQLVNEGLIHNPTLFRFLVRYYGVGRDLRAGRYSLPADASVRDIIQALSVGQQLLVAVTVREGWRAEEIAVLLDKLEIAKRDDFLALVQSGSARLASLPVKPPVPSVEGYLFPDTYLVPKEYGAEAFWRLMLGTFAERFPEEMRQQAKEKGLTVHQVVTLASIVEREAAKPEEQPLVASVFLNRLHRDMKLDADPTVQYALSPPGSPPPREGYWKKELTVEDLVVASPYNTYIDVGLPPAPIANPGLGAIKAVLNPSETSYLYFVAKPDGSHAFASTFDEHRRNVARYQQAR